jgi:glutamyl-Q tRNA(Asp) synthetase
MTVGRFAPSPTGPLHFGSLIAAAGSWLFARRDDGPWLVRIEDLDTARVIPGAEAEILEALERYGLECDGVVVRQSERIALYEASLEALLAKGLVYDCACSRAELQRAASAPNQADAIYPGTCRQGLPERKAARAVRFRAPAGSIAFRDLVRGEVIGNVAEDTGDFVIKRADGAFAYQLAVVVDDAVQGVTQVVRGGDLLTSTARQIALQRALELPTPEYAHLPLIVNGSGEKLGKRDGALPLPSLDEQRVATTLQAAFAVLGIPNVGLDTPRRMLTEALKRFAPERIPATDASVGVAADGP